jgi:hypothetical protein
VNYSFFSSAPLVGSIEYRATEFPWNETRTSTVYFFDVEFFIRVKALAFELGSSGTLSFLEK